jgi:hypothetical protein
MTPPNADQPNESPRPEIRVLKGAPRDDELAALVAVLGSAGGGAAEPGPSEHDQWGLLVDKLRYTPFSWQIVTLVQRTKLRR